MYYKTGSSRAGTQLAALVSAVLVAVAATNINAETIKTVNGEAIDSSVLDFYLTSRTQKPVDQVTAEERTILVEELTDIYLLSNNESATEVEKDPQVQAQIELQRRGVIAQMVASKFFEGIVVTEEEILAMYDAQASLAPALQYKARHILLESQGEAVEVIGELDMGGNFEELAKSRSTGPSGPNGGDLGWFSPNQMVASFSEAVQALEDGKYTVDPVQTELGWHVIFREESIAAEAPTLDSSREVILQGIQQSKFQAYLEGLRANMTE
jgi:peptidyl-prolyl cis-trans isomerase C